jgi:hypothetical protein
LPFANRIDTGVQGHTDSHGERKVFCARHEAIVAHGGALGRRLGAGREAPQAEVVVARSFRDEAEIPARQSTEARPRDTIPREGLADILVVSLLGTVHCGRKTHVHAQVTVTDHQAVDCRSASNSINSKDASHPPERSTHHPAKDLDGMIRTTWQSSELFGILAPQITLDLQDDGGLRVHVKYHLSIWDAVVVAPGHGGGREGALAAVLYVSSCPDTRSIL